jgi:hypothetical protein
MVLTLTFASRAGHVVDTTPLGDTWPEAKNVYEKDPDHRWIYGGAREYSQADWAGLKTIMQENKASFAYSVADLPGYCGDAGPCHVLLNTTDPIRSFPRRKSELEQTIENDKCLELMMNGIIVPCPHHNNLYAANNTLPAKKDAENNWTDRRFCTDLRQINAATIADPLQMPLVQDLFELTRDSTIFTKLDLRAGYHQIPVAEDSQAKLAFWWGKDLFMYKRMPMGAKNSSAIFQRIMDFELTKAGLSHCAMAYQDDILIHSRCPKEHNDATQNWL